MSADRSVCVADMLRRLQESFDAKFQYMFEKTERGAIAFLAEFVCGELVDIRREMSGLANNSLQAELLRLRERIDSLSDRTSPHAPDVPPVRAEPSARDLGW